MKHPSQVKVNYEKINHYWNNAMPSILGPYMMDGFGFPSSAGRFRFHAECRIVNQLIQDQRRRLSHPSLEFGRVDEVLS